MGFNQYLSGLTELEMINRAPGYFKYFPHSVAAHSWKVTQVAQFLGDIEEQHGEEVNWKLLYEKALNHDINERFIGDIRTPVKYASSELRHMLADVEESLADNFIRVEIPEEYRDSYHRRLTEGKDDTLEGRILSVSDKIDLLYEAFGELQKGNPEPVFMEIYKESLETIYAFRDMKSTDYFIHEVLPEMLAEEFPGSERLQRIYIGIFNRGSNEK
ncbi:YfbR-like 5'-deoxynucleotidase [Weissella koreensis]|uniref:HD domain-containing protein n=1 Tax=Weissella koreensis TaxID=165096 RepID=A0A7H1MN75_9LACO|nr:YfbR-like 5'-deoxynucleotidase [Weissella koreensis]AEJ24097.1 HD superfamily hydrolase [Weissella koreensis KACC 15510]AVH75709.1 HD domain-containing protein [Weissella koreensis]EJF34698.1 HD superfamily phosphohydrolase [Weissella koreensis KCTC 3621]QGN20930.1 HD domain-containing protein [Weissella koreensis]QNT64911.1 HD domain-containing protein [Weissella koreensis]